MTILISRFMTINKHIAHSSGRFGKNIGVRNELTLLLVENDASTKAWMTSKGKRAKNYSV